MSLPFLTRVRIRNYKSIAKCDVELGALTFLVGRNGSGKSNFLDALRFVVDGLESSLDHAVKSRGGIDAVRRRSTGHPNNFALELVINFSASAVATYGFELAAQKAGGFIVKQERMRIVNMRNEVIAAYHVKEGQHAKLNSNSMPPASPDRLYLVNAAGLPEFRGVYDALLAMGFYNLNPEAMKELQSPDAGELLHRDGANVSSVVARLARDKPQVFARIKEYLAAIVPGITDLERVPLGPRETLEFRQEVSGSQHPWRFYAASMSDGTLRALGSLLAVMQLSERKDPARLVGIEEPEAALHPAATGALMNSLREAAVSTQVLVTTHSPDLLDKLDLESDRLLVMQSTQGQTEVAPVDVASYDAIKNHLYSAGELLRMDQLDPDRSHLERHQQLQLFESFAESA